MKINILILSFLLFIGACSKSLEIVTPSYSSGTSQEFVLAQDSTVSGQLVAILNRGNQGTFSVITPPVNGSVVLDPSGSFTYTPNTGFFGVDSLTYKLSSTKGESAPTEVKFSVMNLSTLQPIALNQTPPTLIQNAESSITLSYTDLQGDQASGCSVVALTNVTETTPCSCNSGVCIVGVTGTTNYVGAASFTFRVTASGDQSNVGQVNFTVATSNTAPSLTTVTPLPGAFEASSFPISYATLASAADEADANGDAISFKILAHTGILTIGGNPVLSGTTVITNGDSVVWTPAPGLTGAQNAFTVKAWDGSLHSITPISVVVNVTPITLAIQSLTMQPNGYYNAGDTLDFVVNLNRVSDASLPNALPIRSGLTYFYATKLSQTTNSQTYRYTVIPGLNTPSGIDMTVARASLSYPGTNLYSGVIIDTTNPVIPTVANDAVPRKSKTWNWSCSETCTYRYTVSTSNTWTPTGAFAAGTTTTYSSGDGTYYLHVQAQDQAGNLSAVLTTSTLMDNTAPAAPTTITLLRPSTATGYAKRPTVLVSGVNFGNTISIHTLNTCSLPSFKGSEIAFGTQAEILTISLSLGIHEFYAKAKDRAGNESACSVLRADYEVLAMPAGTYPNRAYSTGLLPKSVFATDLNGDGLNDLITADTNSHSIRVRLNTGSGFFGAHSTYPTGSAPVSVFAIDLNGDGRKDIMSANYNGASASVFINSGTGNFGAATNYASGTQPNAVYSADLNGDGFNDLITAESGTNTIGLRLNNGSGVFGARTTLATGSSPMSVFAADLNGDGFKDLMVANSWSNSFHVRFNNGTGGFSGATGYVTGAEPRSIFAIDLNGDGFRDIMTADYSSNQVSIRFNNGSGVFGAQSILPQGDGTSTVYAMDLNGDGFNDLMSTNVLSRQAFVQFNTGTGSFGPSVTYAGASNGIFAEDMNGDGVKDLLTTGSEQVRIRFNNGTGSFNSSLSPEAVSYPTTGLTNVFSADLNGDGFNDLLTCLSTNQVNVRLNNGLGILGSAVSYSTGTNPASVYAADLNGDGSKDLVTADSGSNQVSIRFNNGAGIFGAATTYTTGSSPRSVVAMDLNGDGSNDLITADTVSNQVSFRFNNGSGIFGAASTITVGSYPYSVFVADVNNDGHNDFMTADYFSNQVRVHLNSGTATFPSWATYATGTQPRSVTASDLNNDGFKDLVSAEGGSNQISVRFNTGTGTFGAPTIYTTSTMPESVVSADINSDGHNDLVTADNAQQINVRYNNGFGSFGVLTTFATDGNPTNLTVSDLNNDGVLDFSVVTNLSTSTYIWK